MGPRPRCWIFQPTSARWAWLPLRRGRWRNARGCATATPTPLCRQLSAAIAGAEGTPPEWVLCGNGAADLIWRAALALRPARALVTAPTFAEYECALAAVGCRTERFSLRQEEDFRLGEGFLEAIRPGVDLVFLCEPNNPTGLTTPRPLLERILARCRAAGGPAGGG